MVSIQDYVSGNGRYDNKKFTIDSGESVTLHFKDSGVDTATDKFYNLQSEATKISISVNKIATITKINNFTLSSPRTLGTANDNTLKRGIQLPKMTVRADLDTTNFEIFALG